MQVLFAPENHDNSNILEGDEELSYNDTHTNYSTDLNRRGIPRYEEVQIRFNNILQKRDQLEENLTGSQITYLLDFYIEQCFNVLDFIAYKGDVRQQQHFMDQVQREYETIVKELLHNRRKLFSIRFLNEDIYDTITALFFDRNYESFKRKFLSIKLNREFYLKFLENICTNIKASSTLDLTDVEAYYQFYKKQYTEIKNLLLGNYIRYAFSETNKFFSYYKDRLSLEVKEDYFSGLMLVILRVIDKYDSFKGTLTSFIENWLKDYRTTFKARQTLVSKALDVADETYLDECSLEEEFHESSLNETLSLETRIVESLILTLNKPYEEIQSMLQKHQELFPTLLQLVTLQAQANPVK